MSKNRPEPKTSASDTPPAAVHPYWKYLPPLAIVLASVIMFSPFIFQGKVFLATDTLYAFYPWKSYAAPGFRPHNMLITDPVNHNYAENYNRQLHLGDLKNWNPFMYTGMPATGVTAQSGMSGRYYPLKMLLHKYLRTFRAHDLLIFLHVTLMGLTMYLFLKEIGAGKRGALFGAVAYMFNGCAMVWLEFESTVASSAFFPLLLLCVDRFQGKKRYLYAFIGSGVLGMIWLMGHLQYLLYAVLLMLFYFAFVLYREYLRRAPVGEYLHLLACFGITGAGGLLIGAIEILPMVELLNSSGRINRTFEFGTYFTTLGRVPFRYLVTLAFPDFFGSPPLKFNLIPSLPTQEYMNYCELALYFGIPSLFALLACALAPKNDHTRFFLFMTVLVALLMTGTFVYYPFFKLYPGMNKMNPTRIVWLFTFVASAAAGLGIRGLDRLAGIRRSIFLGLAALLEAAIVFVAVFASKPFLVRFFNAEHFPAGSAETDGLFAAVSGLRTLSSPVIMKPLLLSLAAAALFALLVLVRKREATVVLFAAVVALLAYELIGAARSYNTIVESKYVYPSTPSIEFLRAQPRPFRVLLDSSRGFQVNTIAPFGLEEVGGYSSFYPGNINTLMSFIEYGPLTARGIRFDRWIIFRNLRSPLFDLLNAKYFLTAPGIPLNAMDSKLKLVFRGDMDIYENSMVMPRAFAVHRAVPVARTEDALSYMASPLYDMRNEVVLSELPDPSFAAGASRASRPPAVAMERYDIDEVGLSADLSANGWVVLTDTYYPGWKAYVDGTETPIVLADVNYRAVPVKEGKHTVVFRYRPASFILGGAVTMVGLLGTLAGIILFAFTGKPPILAALWARLGRSSAPPA